MRRVLAIIVVAVVGALARAHTDPVAQRPPAIGSLPPPAGAAPRGGPRSS